MTDELKQLVADIETALAKGHRGYTVYGTQMDLVVQALRTVIENKGPAIKRSVVEPLPGPHIQL